MEAFRDIDIIIYAQLILMYILINIHRYGDKKELSTKLFILIIYSLSIVNILEGITWIINGLQFPLCREVNLLTNTTLLMCNSLPAVTWLMYADYKIFNNTEGLKKRIKYYLIPLYITIILLITNFWTGFVFIINNQNLYSRGPGVSIIALMTYIMIISLYFQTRKFRKQINGKIIQAIFLFMLIPIIAGIIQMLSYGLLIIWPAFVFASMIAYFHIERDSILRDPLTGLATREQFENRAHYLMNKKINFYVIMIDMNQFKKINDQFGHSEGDQALIISTSILKQNVKTYDLVCRYGGDEFVILIETVSENEIVKINQRIHHEFDTFNHKNIKNYDLSISHGYAKWDSSLDKSLSEILCEADSMMYTNKQNY